MAGWTASDAGSAQLADARAVDGAAEQLEAVDQPVPAVE